MGKGGGCARGVSSAISDLVNAILECGGGLDKAVKALEDHDCWKRQCCSNEIAKCLMYPKCDWFLMNCYEKYHLLKQVNE